MVEHLTARLLGLLAALAASLADRLERVAVTLGSDRDDTHGTPPRAWSDHVRRHGTLDWIQFRHPAVGRQDEAPGYRPQDLTKDEVDRRAAPQALSGTHRRTPSDPGTASASGSVSHPARAAAHGSVSHPVSAAAHGSVSYPASVEARGSVSYPASVAARGSDYLAAGSSKPVRYRLTSLEAEVDPARDARPTTERRSSPSPALFRPRGTSNFAGRDADGTSAARAHAPAGRAAKRNEPRNEPRSEPQGEAAAGTRAAEATLDPTWQRDSPPDPRATWPPAPEREQEPEGWGSERRRSEATWSELVRSELDRFKPHQADALRILDEQRHRERLAREQRGDSWNA